MRRLLAGAVLALGIQCVAAPAARGDGTPEASSCSESVPEGAVRPVLTEELPARGLSGHEVRFVVRVEHGRGETVLPRGLQLQA